MADLNKLYKQHYSFAKREVRTWGCNRSIFDELYQRAFCILAEKQKSGGSENIYTKCYITQLCKHLWFQERKTMALYVALDGTMDFEYEERDIKAEKAELLMKHFNKLSKICRKVLTLFSLGYNEKKILDRLNLSDRNVVKNKKYYCKEKLRNMIISDPEFEEIYE